jgi:ABC-type antimicrobial peptide transport system permease subunit
MLPDERNNPMTAAPLAASRTAPGASPAGRPRAGRLAPVWLTLRAGIRQRWRALVGLALLLGLIGGVALTAAAGARRTDTAYPRLLAWASAAQVDLIPQGTGLDGGVQGGFYGALAKLPQVQAMGVGQLYQASLPGKTDVPVALMSSPDGGLGTRVDRVKVLAGTMFDPATPGVAVINRQMAALEHLSPGDTVRVLGVPNGRDGTPDFRQAALLAFRVTGIVVIDTQVVASGSTNSQPTIMVSQPFSATAQAKASSYGDEAAVRLRPGTSVAAFIAAANKVAGRYGTADPPRGTGGKVDAVTLADQVSATQRVIGPQATALAIFAALTALIALVVISQLLSRQLTLDSADFPVLRAIGLTRGALVVLSLARLAVVTVSGAVLAVVVAVAASPVMPIGPARVAEPHPGVEVDPVILGAGLAVIALVPLAALARAAWRAAGAPSGPLGVAGPAFRGRPSRLGALLSRSGSTTGGIGVRMAFEAGRGRMAVPVRSALAGSVVAVAAVMSAAVFGASLVGLISTPHRYGQNWDAMTDLGFGGVTLPQAGQFIGRFPAITQFAAGDYGEVTIGGKSVAAVGIKPVHGTGFLTVLSGRAPAAPGEIALGAQTMRSLGLRVGQVVMVTPNHVNTGAPDTPVRMRVTGVVVFPGLSRGSFAPTGLGTGALVPVSVIGESATGSGCSDPVCLNFFLLRFRPGTDVTAASATMTQLLRASGCPVDYCPTGSDQRPGDIKSYTGIRDTPLALGVVLAVLAIGTLAHVLLTGVRRRARDLALLKTLGLTRSQVLRVVAWEASAFAAVALLIGLPAGMAAGRWAWALFADSAGVSPAPDVPLALILLAIPATLALANLIAAWPGWRAARVRPAAVLRSE